MCRTEHWLEPTRHRLIGEQRVKIHRNLGYPDAMPLGRYRRVQVSQGLLIVEPRALRHEALDELQHTVGTINEPTEDLARISANGAVATFVKQPFGSGRALGRRKIEKRQEIARLVM